MSDGGEVYGGAGNDGMESVEPSREDTIQSADIDCDIDNFLNENDNSDSILESQDNFGGQLDKISEGDDEDIDAFLREGDSNDTIAELQSNHDQSDDMDDIDIFLREGDSNDAIVEPQSNHDQLDDMDDIDVFLREGDSSDAIAELQSNHDQSDDMDDIDVFLREDDSNDVIAELQSNYDQPDDMDDIDAFLREGDSNDAIVEAEEEDETLEEVEEENETLKEVEAEEDETLEETEAEEENETLEEVEAEEDETLEEEEVEEEDETLEEEEVEEEDEALEEEEVEEDEALEKHEKENQYYDAIKELTKYMSDHNYGKEDYAEYSRDPEWQRLTEKMESARENKDYVKDREKGNNQEMESTYEETENQLEDENNIEIVQEGEEERDFQPNSIYKINGNIYETDDRGTLYKKNGDLLPSTSYEINGTRYETDEKGRILSWSGNPKYTPENERDTSAQTEAGGEDREDGDDGGHLLARILGGSAGKENIVPMRATINRGDYKRLENEIIKAKNPGKDGLEKDVQDSGRIIYEGNSTRPSKIERTVIIDGKKTELTVDNIEGSKDLLSGLDGVISAEDWDRLNDEITDMEEDGNRISVTSVMKKYDASGNLVSVTVGVRNETAREKSYKTFSV